MEHRTAKSTYLKITQDELTAWSAGDAEQESCILCQSEEEVEERENQETH